MYILDIVSAINRLPSKKSNTLYSKTIIEELELLKKTVIIL